MKAQIISKTRFMVMPNGEMVHLLRTNTTENVSENNSRTYVIRTEYAKFESTSVNSVDADGNLIEIITTPAITEDRVLENGKTIVVTTTPAVIEYQKEIVQTIKTLGIMKITDISLSSIEINGFSATLTIPKNINEVEQNLFKRKSALLYMTINDKDAPKGYMGTKDWEIID